MNENRQAKHQLGNHKSAPSDTVKSTGNSIFYKFLWYAICFFVSIIFVIQLKSNSDDKETKITFETFFNGTFQAFYENKLLKKPFITDLKKYKNEYEYLLLNKINLEDSYAGKENFIFSENMTKAYFGDDYYGEAAIKNQVQKAKFVQNKLKKYGIELLILFAPGKSSIYPEFLSDYILKTKKKTRNSEIYVNECKNQNVNFIDFIQFFRSMKTSTKYPLFSRYGSHWSYYAECIVVDTTIKRLEKLMNADLPNIRYSDIRLMDTAQVRDGDIFRKTDMEIPKGNTLAYPQKIEYDQGITVKPQKILGIGDSYFRGFFYLGAMEYAFDNSQQWYYYNKIIPENTNNPEVWELDLKTEILKNKAIIILCNEANLKNLGNGFIDDAYALFSNPEKYYLIKKEKDEINKYKKIIRNNQKMLTELTRNSYQRRITLDSLITETAVDMRKDRVKLF